MALIEVGFPGNKRVDANIKGFTVNTDQPISGGGDGGAPSPFDLFLSSIATCAGIYALIFCENKGIDTTGLKLALDVIRNEENGGMDQIDLKLNLPEGFPQKYEKAIINAMNLCTVKKFIANPPEFTTSIQK
ncbi:OsmC family protein [Alkaliphilus metalliredigens QYMF]|uniref:OsmC family protein n=1 Tax=Alkaliphilus metalliredigens (strain QYMF) TaxID=293826 RepID=A6TTW8_ALKMQ|nr:OsmC family protein [Alkaliphilus metalliredigens]ABR49636.1 OsmC family protein [Alkaliphilus metalliredigens QYMF]